MNSASRIYKNSVVGWFLRKCLRLVPSNIVIPISNGRLKGKKWIKGSGVNAYWLGIYEIDKQKLFEQIVKPGDVVFDIGAHVGFYTLLASELVGITGKVFAFEPLPRNINFLKKHLKLNRLGNVKIFEFAVSDKEENVFFGELSNSFSGRIIEQEKGIRVKSVILDNLIKSKKLLPPNVLKIDVEGNELAVLKGAEYTIEQYRPAIFLATHTEKIHNECINFLKKFKYNIQPIVGENVNKTGEILAYVPDRQSRTNRGSVRKLNRNGRKARSLTKKVNRKKRT